MRVKKNTKELMLPCPSCLGEGGRNVRYNDYYGHKFEWRKCHICQGTGEVTLSQYKKIKKELDGDPRRRRIR